MEVKHSRTTMEVLARCFEGHLPFASYTDRGRENVRGHTHKRADKPRHGPRTVTRERVSELQCTPAAGQLPVTEAPRPAASTTIICGRVAL